MFYGRHHKSCHYIIWTSVAVVLLQKYKTSSRTPRPQGSELFSVVKSRLTRHTGLVSTDEQVFCLNISHTQYTGILAVKYRQIPVKPLQI